jgi:hypothetical protein
MTEKEFFNHNLEDINDDMEEVLYDLVMDEIAVSDIIEPTGIVESNNSLPEDDALRGDYAMADGLLDYFPNALAEVAKVSKVAGDKHHPGEPMHWERSKSTDHRNKIMRHLVDSGRFDSKGNRHSAALAWRALALLQEELEAEGGIPAPRNAVD